MKSKLLRVIAVLLTVIFSVSSMVAVLPTLVSADVVNKHSAKNSEKTPVLPFAPFNANGMGEAKAEINKGTKLFTETDTVVISSETELRGIIAEAPEKDNSVSSVLKVTPMVSGSAVTYNYATVTHTFQKTSVLTEEKGLKIDTVSGKEYEIADTTASQAYSNIAFEKRNSFVGADGVMFYLKLDAANVVAPNFAAFVPETVGRWKYDFDPVLMLMVGKEYSYKSINDTSWTTKTAIQDKAGGAYYGAMKFDSAFEGYVKIPLESLGNDMGFTFKPNQDSFKLMCIRSTGLGGKYGTLTAGPYFVVNKDSVSTDIEVNKSSFSSAPANIGAKINGFKYPLKNADALLIYAKTDSANRISVSANMWDDYLSDIPSLVLKADAEAYVSPLNSGVWTEIKTVRTEADGAIQFDTAFEGYIKIPISSLKEQEASPFIAIYPEIDYITGVEICSARIGGKFGKIEVAPFLINEDKGTTNFEVSDEYKPPVASATEVVPVLNTEIQKGNWQTVTHTEVKPLDFTGAIATQMTAKSEEGYENSNINSSQAYANFKFNDGSLKGYEGLVFYIKTDGANVVTPQIALNIPNDTTRWKHTWDPILTVKLGAQYDYLPMGSEEWQTGVTVQGVAGSAFYGAVKLDNAFEGYIKVPFSSLENDSGFSFSTELDTVKNIVYRAKGLGGSYGQVTLGPTMFVTKDGKKGIKLKDPDPIVVNLITAWKSNQTAQKSTQTVVAPLDWTTAKGLKISANAKYTNDYPANSLAYARFKTNEGFTLGDATHVIWYIKTDSANTVLPRIAYSSAAFNISYDPEMTLGVGKSYSYMPIGGDKWLSATSVPTWKNGGNVSNTYFGGMQFDSAFEGYVKIAIADLSNDNARINNADRTTTPISNLIVSVAKIGEEYGTVTAGPVFLTNKDSDSPKIEIYEEPNENANVAINATPICATVEDGGINYENVSPFRGLTLEGYKLSAQNGNVFKVITDTALKGSDRLLVYLKTQKDTVIVPKLMLNKPNDISRWSGEEQPCLTLGVGNEYKILGFDNVKWVKASSVKDDKDTYNGGISLKAGFEGYVSIPYTSLVNEKGFVLDAGLDSIGSVEFKVNNPDDEKNEVIIAPISLITNKGEGVEVIYPTSYDAYDPYERIQGIFERSKLGLAQANYYMVGDSTRHLYGYPIFRIVRNALKENFNVNCTVQALSGLKAEHWSGYTPGLDGPLFPTVEQLIEQIPGTGRNCIVDLSLAINDSAKTGDKVYEFLIMGLNKVRQAKPEAVIVYTSPSLISFAKQNKNIYDAAELVWADKSIYKIDVMKNVFDDYYSQYYADTHHPNSLGYKLIGQYIVTQYVEGLTFDKIYDIDYTKYTLPKDANPIKSTLSVSNCHNLTAGVYSMNVNGADVNSIKLNGSKICTGEVPYSTQNYIQTELSSDLKGNDYIAFYLKLPAANKLGIRAFTTEDNKEIIFMRGMKYYVMPLGSDKWTEKISTNGRKDKIETYGSLDFDGAFEGWVRLPLYSFYGAPTADNPINGVTFRFSELGGTYGEVRVGSFFAISDAKAADKQYTLPKDAKPITSKLSIFKSHNLSGRLYDMQVNGVKVDAIRVNGSATSTGEYPFNTQNYIQTQLSSDLKDNDYIAFYLKLPAANKLGVRAFTTEDNKEIIFMRGMKYYVMPIGSDKWTEKISTDGRKDKIETYGSLDFDGAFEGWVRLPLYSFYGAPTADNPINGVTFRFSDLGGAYGEVCIGSFFAISDAKSADKDYTLPKDAKPITSKLSIFKAHNISARIYNMKVNGKTVDAIRINGSASCTGNYPYNTQNYIQTELSKPLKDNDYIAFYLKLPAANKIGVRAFKTAENKEIIFRRDMKYYIMPIGSSKWTAKTSTDGRKDKIDTYGSLDFEGAFEGWVRLPLDGFYGSPSAYEDLNGVTFRFSELGGTYGEVCVGSFFAISDKPYTAKNVWKKSELPEMTPFTPITELDSAPWVYRDYIESPIPSLSTNKALVIGSDPVADYGTPNYAHSTHWVSTAYEEMSLGEFTHLVFYVKVPKTKENRFILHIDTSEGVFQIMANMSFQLLPMGETKWQHYVTDRTINSIGGVILPAGFEGLVKIPSASLLPANRLTDKTILKKIFYRFSYIGMGEDRVLVGPAFGVTKDNDTGPDEIVYTSLPEATTIKSLYAIEDKDKFTDTVMLYWEAFEGAKYYIAEAYSITKTENGFEYRLVASNRCVSNSGAITDLMPGRQYAVLIKAYDLRDNLLAIYDYTMVETPETDWCDYPTVSDEMNYDKVYYPEKSNASVGIGGLPTLAIIIGGVSIVLLAGVAIVFAVIYKRRKKNA